MELKGIDVSKWNGTIDWKKVAASGVQFAMVRAGTGKAKGGATVDPRFLDNVYGAHENGISVGVFFYSYAMSAEAAMKEADTLIGILAPVREKITFPVAYDLEETEQSELGRDECTEMVRLFCETIGNAVYTPILYTNPNWLKNFLHADKITVPIWLAHVERKPWGSNWQGEYVMHQYSWVGSVPGISGDVDMNVSKIDFAEEQCMRYKTVEECPSWARETVEKLVSLGIIRGRGDERGLDLTEDMLRMLVWNDRAGVYDG